MTDNVVDQRATVPLRITDPQLIPAERYFNPDFFEQEITHLWPHVGQMACRLAPK